MFFIIIIWAFRLRRRAIRSNIFASLILASIPNASYATGKGILWMIYFVYHNTQANTPV